MQTVSDCIMHNFNEPKNWLYGEFMIIFFKLDGSKKGMLYLMTHSTHFIYSYMASDIYGKGPLG